MQKPLATALCSALVAAAIVIGCSAPSPDGSSVPRGRSSSGAPAPGQVLEANEGEDAGGGAATCTNHDAVDDRPACDSCSRAKCCAQVLECDKTPDCKAMMKCIGDCADDDIACVLTCQLGHDKGAALLGDLASCVQESCEAECPSSAPDGGDDPFGDL